MHGDLKKKGGKWQGLWLRTLPCLMMMSPALCSTSTIASNTSFRSSSSRCEKRMLLFSAPSRSSCTARGFGVEFGDAGPSDAGSNGSQQMAIRLCGADGREAPEAVTVATCFRAKGLQWPVVFLPGCNEGRIPHPRAPVEDERRLFYVALTRASQELIASWVAVPRGEARPSRFLAEAGMTV